MDWATRRKACYRATWRTSSNAIIYVRQGHTDEEVAEILDLAARLQVEASSKTDYEILVQSAEEAGIHRDFVEQAMHQIATRWEQENRPQQRPTPRKPGWVRWILTLLGSGLLVLFLLRVLHVGGSPVGISLIPLLILFFLFAAVIKRLSRERHRPFRPPGGERVCLHCGRVNASDARFCNDCGEEI